MRFLQPKTETEEPAFTPRAKPATQAELSQLPALQSLIKSQTTPPLTNSEESIFTTQSTLIRYLRARSHDVQKASAMLQASITFHRARPTPFVCSTCTTNPASHSFFPIGPAFGEKPATLGEATLVMYSNFLVADREIGSVTLHMQSAMGAMFDDASLHRMVWVIDFEGFCRSDMSPTQARRTLKLFADHFPERLGCAVIYDAPRAFAALWMAVRLFAAPETVAKVVFVHRGEEREGFEGAGVVGDTFKRVLEEIQVARDGGEKGAWWGRAPLPPLVDYGARINGVHSVPVQGDK